MPAVDFLAAASAAVASVPAERLLANVTGVASTNATNMAFDFLANQLALDNATLGNASGNATGLWPAREGVEHFLGDPDVLHAAALALGVVSIMFGRTLPHLLAVASSVSLGLWVGLVVQDQQRFRPKYRDFDLPQGVWLPVLLGLLASAAAGVLSIFTWRTALVLLTAGLMMLVVLALCRLVNISPEGIFEFGASLLSAYRVVGAVVLVIAILASSLLVRRFHKGMITFSSAHLGTLLMLSGTSHFVHRVGASAPFSLLDDLARVVSEVRGGQCHIWTGDGAGDCHCGDKCRAEVTAWILSSWTVIVWRLLRQRLRERSAGKKASEEERAPLSEEREDGPMPEVIGAPDAPASPQPQEDDDS